MTYDPAVSAYGVFLIQYAELETILRAALKRMKELEIGHSGKESRGKRYIDGICERLESARLLEPKMHQLANDIKALDQWRDEHVHAIVMLKENGYALFEGRHNDSEPLSLTEEQALEQVRRVTQVTLEFPAEMNNVWNSTRRTQRPGRS